MTEIDILADIHREVGEGPLETITRLAGEAADCEQSIAVLEQSLKDLEARREAILSHLLPDAMDEGGVREFTLTDGTKIEIRDIVAGSIAKKNLVEAIAWLKDHGYSDLIKTEVSVAFARGAVDEAEELATTLRDLDLRPEVKTAVHPQTLGAWAREQLASGVSLPFELLGIFTGRKAKISTKE